MTETPNQTGRVALVGAGPGDPGLLTLTGKHWLSRADVVVYDHLVSPNLLRFAPDTAELIYAGKKAGYAVLKQEAINALLVDKARAGLTVVRLKGGDPFIFGRGGEEAQQLKQAGIPFVVVPGVSSPMGVSAYAGIPLTHRDASSSISIITGSNEKQTGDLRIDWEKIASRSGTLVFLMGARKLSRISENLLRYGKDPDTPVAVIQWGTTARQKTWTGTLKTIVDIAAQETIQPPALTIIGEVANYKPHIEWYENLPLFGKTIAVTRAEDQSESFIEALQEKGAEAYSYPVIQTLPPETWQPLDAALDALTGYDGIIFTSVNGVRYFMQRLKERKKDIRDLHGQRVYTIGPKTEQAVLDLGIRVDVVPSDFVAESLIAALKEESLKDKRFLLPRAAVAREILPDTLRSLGAHVDVAPAYRTVIPKDRIDDFARRLEEKTIDVVTFTSSSTVTHFLEKIGPERKHALKHVAIACIGPVTEKTARDAGLNVAILPQSYTVDALAEAIENHFHKK